MNGATIPIPEWVQNPAKEIRGLDLLGLRQSAQTLGLMVLSGIATVTPTVKYFSICDWIIKAFGASNLPAHLYLGASSEWGVVSGEEKQLATGHSPLTEMFPTPRDAVDYIMDTFPIVRRKDEAKYDGDYRTKRVILEIYDAMAEAIRTGSPYQTRLDPPPADPCVAHPPRTAADRATHV